MRLRGLLRGFIVLLMLVHPALSASVKSLYGEVPIDHPLLVELLETPAFKRLKEIDVAGPSRYFRNLPTYPMFDHALGVYVLLKKFNLPVKEQIAGVLAFTSHSVFGEFGSFLFDTTGRDIFNVDTEEDFFRRTKLDSIIEKHGFKPHDLYPLQEDFKAISAMPPDLSAGEIEQNIRMAFSYNLITQESINKVMSDLRFEQGRWFFIDTESAHKLGMISLYFTEHFWGAPVTFVINRWFGSAIKRATDIHLLNLNLLRFGTDKAVLKDLLTTQDTTVLGFLYKARQPYRFFRVAEDKEPYDFLYQPKFEGLDPYVKVGNEFKRLSDIDPIYKTEFERVKTEFGKGIHIKYRDENMRMGSKPGQEDLIPNLGNNSVSGQPKL